jgi:hypothetical protein
MLLETSGCSTHFSHHQSISFQEIAKFRSLALFLEEDTSAEA